MEEIADVEMSPSTPTVNIKEVVEKWFEKFNKGVLAASHFQEFWRTWVPRTFSPSINDSCLNWNFNEEDAQNTLIRPLEEFIFNGDPHVVLSQLSKYDKAPSVCGRVFKMGEPTYSCRECGMDSTCVLCVDCFKQSEHRFHKYKMGTSGGGGCCDCGDKEAWKKAPFCDVHIVGIQEEAEVSNKLPEDLLERTRIVFEAVLWYAYNLLTIEHTADLRHCYSEDSLGNVDTYCTILYNDEVHTFEQVIGTLNRVLKCSQRNAIEYVTNIDREGRAVVKCSTFQHCNNFKSDIEKHTSRQGSKPLKVLVVHSHVVAHQYFAMKLLAWMQTFMGHGESFRATFSEVALKPQQSDPCIVKGILTRDSQLWKSARTHWHRLLISGMLLEYENKKALAKIFTRDYGTVMKDFIKDDHEHSFSIGSLSVQLFTVPTLAHHLIANDDALAILLNTFLSECSHKCNGSGKLEFERNVSSQGFKRAQYMLYDLRYLLSSIPETWTDDLRRSFLHGITLLLNLLTMMQGMDLVVRQIGQHMEYEPEWESAFNLHIKLAYCVSLALKWCGSDRIVLIKAYRLTLKALQNNPCYDPSALPQLYELLDHRAACIVYEVAMQPVSIHLPLSRFLAGLHLHLDKFNLHFNGPEFVMPKPTPIQIIEPVLRTQAMIAQVHAGMWRRNGYALLNQLYFYHNVKCRTEMLDRDIQLLQVGASLIESNEFIIHLLHKYNLVHWSLSNYETRTLKLPEEEAIRQVISLGEEFLQLLISIIGERYIPGISDITTEDRVKKEIIQQLCTRPLPHSELNKAIPDDITHETGLDEVIQVLAEFKKPSQGNGKGVYELKNEFFEGYNVFFYHYTREELSKSEEAQRKRRKAAGELDCCPPPPLPKLKESFTMIVNLLQCDMMLDIMRIVLERCINLKSRCFSELQLHKVLHLIGFALLEEQSGNYPFFVFSKKSLKWRLAERMEELIASPRIDSHKNLLCWTLNKYREVASIALNVLNVPSSSVTTTVIEDCQRNRKAKLAAQKRANVMAQMTAMQNQFMKENAKLFEETESELVSGSNLSGSVMDISEGVNEQPVCLGPGQTARCNVEKTYTCILCQETQKLTIDGPVLVLAAFVQQSSVLCIHRKEHASNVLSDNRLYLNSNRGPAPHTGTCGHVMHATCWQKYFDNVTGKEHRRPYRLRHPASFDVDKQEYLCPLCECLSNTALPLVPPLSSLQTVSTPTTINFDEWLTCILGTLQTTSGTDFCVNPYCTTCKQLPDKPPNSENVEQESQVTPAEQIVNNLNKLGTNFLDLFPKEYPNLDEQLINIIHIFIQVPYTLGLNVNPNPEDARLAPMTWKSLAFTLHTVEVILRDSNKPLLGNFSSRHRDALETLIRISGVLGSTWKNNTVINGHALSLLSLIMNHGSCDPCILDWDSLGILVSLTFSLPSLFYKHQPTAIPVGGVLEMHTLQLVFTAHIVKILSTMNMGDLDESFMDLEDHDIEIVKLSEDYEKPLIQILHLLNKYKEGLNMSTVWSYLQTACLPFLRCAVIFYHFLTDVPAPLALAELGGDTFENCCVYLALPKSPPEIFNSQTMFNIVEKWCKHEALVTCTNFESADYEWFAKLEPHAVNQLIELPTDYSELINTVSSFTCPNSDHEDSRNPTMCLVCGEILCSQSYCCQTEVNKAIVGACNYHAYKYGSGIGVFLRVRECEILFLASPMKGCFISPPYLDAYGETDQGLRRGNPLTLCPERYKKLNSLWLNHTIQEEIARAIESSNNIVATQWQHL